MPRKSKYDEQSNDYRSRAIFPNSKDPFKVWHIAKYIRLSREDDDAKDESNSVVSQNKILDDLIKELARK